MQAVAEKRVASGSSRSVVVKVQQRAVVAMMTLARTWVCLRCLHAHLVSVLELRVWRKGLVLVLVIPAMVMMLLVVIL